MSKRSKRIMNDRISLKCFRLVLLLLSVFFSIGASSQNYPVQASATLVPPYTPYLGDYVSPAAEKLHVQLLLKDLTVSDYQVKLRIRIEGVGITIVSLPNIPVAPIRLQGGSPVQLTSFELKPYFDPANLEFQGLDRNEFVRTGRLPEGLYRFTIEAIDFNREKQASNSATAVAWIVLNDPPLLNLPFDRTKTSVTMPQFIAFQWTPRHMGSPNAAFTTEYIFKLVEMWPMDRDPNDAILSQRPIFETTTTLNQIVYGPGEPQLLAGRTYAWQVTARDTEGRDLFKNQGRSEVRTFQFGDACLPPVNSNSPAQGLSYVRLTWDSDPLHDNYTVRYREQGQSPWYETTSITGILQLNELNAGKTYEYQIQAQCGVLTSDYSTIARATTIAVSEDQFVCGAPYVPAPLNPNEPVLQLLTPNDIIYYHKYKITVTKVTASAGGQFSGEAIQEIPFLNYASIRVTFKDIRVTQSHTIIAGEVISVFDPNSNMVYHDDKKPAPTGGVQQNQGQDTPATVVAQPGIPVVIPGVIETVSVNSGGEIVVQTADGKQTIVTPAKDPVTGEKLETVVSDTAGNTYKVDKEGKITKSSSGIQSAGNSPAITNSPVVEKLISLVISQFEEEISSWLKTNGKGGEDDEEMLKAYEMPEVFPKDAEFLEAFNEEIIGYYKEHPEELRAKMDVSNVSLLSEVSGNFSAPESVDFSKLSEENQVSVRNTVSEELIANCSGEKATEEFVPECGEKQAGQNKPFGARVILWYTNGCRYLLGGVARQQINKGFDAYLCAKERFDLIKCLSRIAILNDDEELIIKLIQMSPPHQKPDLLKSFVDEKEGLLEDLESRFQLRNYITLFKQLNQLYRNATSITDIQKEVANIEKTFNSDQTREGKAKSNAFTWFEGGFLKMLTSDDFVFGRFDDVTIAENGDISFGYATDPRQSGPTTIHLTMKPFALVGFKVRGNANELLETKDAFVYVPAILIPALINEESWQNFHEGVNAAMVATGVTALITGGVRMIAVGGIDLLFGSTGLIVENYKDDILAMKYGQDFMDKYILANKAFAVYFLGRTSIVLLAKALPLLKTSFTALQASEDFLKLKTLNPGKAQEIEAEVKTVLAQGNDFIKNLLINYAKVGVGEGINLTGFTAKTSDQFIDVVVHFEEGKFKILIEEGGVFIEKSLETEQLAAILNQTSSNKSIRLLSCNDIATAKELSGQIPNKSVYASDGWVDLYADGAIQSQNKFQKIVNGEVAVADLDMSSSSSGATNKVRLGTVQPGIANTLSKMGYSLFEEIDDILFIRDASGRIGKIIDQSNLTNITWFTPRSGNTWPIHQTNSSNYLKFKYGNNVTQQLKVRIYNKSGASVVCYLDDVVFTNEGKFIVSDAKHSQKAALVEGQPPGYTENQTQGYQWIIDGDATKIEVIGDKGIPNGINRGRDILPDLDGKVRVLTNNTNGQVVEVTVTRTR